MASLPQHRHTTVRFRLGPQVPDTTPKGSIDCAFKGSWTPNAKRM